MSDADHEVEYLLCGDVKPHGRHEIDPSWVCPGKDTGAMPALDTTRPDGVPVQPSYKIRRVPDPMFCGTKEVHVPHHWDWNDGGEESTYFCEGIARPNRPGTIGEALESIGFDGSETIPASGKAHRFEAIEEEPPTEATEMEQDGRSLPVRWADRAMFRAEPIDASRGPEVHLMWMSPDPMGAIAAACKMYKGEVVRDLREISDDERFEYLQQVMKTKLKAPFEFVKFHFMFEGVSRSFTHQMVRQRTAAYAQESLRFAVKEDMPQYCPPSIRDDPQALAIWQDHNEMTTQAYEMLIDMGIPAEDARGRLPHDTLTRLHYTTDLRALLDHAGNRLCTQAQFEWRLVFAKITEALRKVSTDNITRANGIEAVYFSDMLANVFRPVCYTTGKCEFMADFDRHCNIRDRVQANAAVNRPSEHWSESAYLLDGSQIDPIKPGEWLLDHKSARMK